MITTVESAPAVIAESIEAVTVWVTSAPFSTAVDTAFVIELLVSAPLVIAEVTVEPTANSTLDPLDREV